jgi:hypothetical protein
MKRNDDILKYLSDFMTVREKQDFEKELSLSEDLRNRLDEQKAMLKGINGLADIKEESPYFQNLLPRVRGRMEKKKSAVWVPKWAYLLASSAAVVLLVINLGKFTPVDQPAKNETKVDSNAIVKTEVVDIYQNENLLNDNSLIENAETNAKSLEVGVAEISDKESIKEIIKSRIAYPVEDYLLALK